MSALLIAGATRGVGLELARLERASGRVVMALVREGSDASELRRIGADIVWGDALSSADASSLFHGVHGNCDLVSTIGGLAADGRRADDDGNINLIDAAAASRLEGRFLLVTSIGCGEMAPYRCEGATASFGDAVDAKIRAENHLRRSRLAWTIMRPGGLRNGPATGSGLLTTDDQMHGRISRADVAELAFHALRDPSTVRQTFAAVDASEARSVNPLKPHPLLRFSAAASQTVH